MGELEAPTKLVRRLAALFRIVWLWLLYESNILLIVYFVVLAFPELGRRRRLAHLSVLVTSGLLLSLIVLHITRAAPGAPAILNFAENVAFWSSPRSYFKIIEGYSPLVPFPQGLHCVNLFLVVAIVLLARHRAPIRQRRLFYVMLAIGAPLLLTFGWQDEIRAMALCLIPLYLLACHAVNYLYEMPEKRIEIVDSSGGVKPCFATSHSICTRRARTTRKPPWTHRIRFQRIASSVLDTAPNDRRR
ncbi:MAG TPA: hypothetical protein VIV60_35920 [Polyangiaceae bacterium]